MCQQSVDNVTLTCLNLCLTPYGGRSGTALNHRRLPEDVSARKRCELDRGRAAILPTLQQVHLNGWQDMFACHVSCMPSITISTLAVGHWYRTHTHDMHVQHYLSTRVRSSWSAAQGSWFLVKKTKKIGQILFAPVHPKVRRMHPTDVSLASCGLSTAHASCAHNIPWHQEDSPCTIHGGALFDKKIIHGESSGAMEVIPTAFKPRCKQSANPTRHPSVGPLTPGKLSVKSGPGGKLFCPISVTFVSFGEVRLLHNLPKRVRP